MPSMMQCPKCGAPAGPSAPDGDFKYRPPFSRPSPQVVEALKLALIQMDDDSDGTDVIAQTKVREVLKSIGEIA